MTREVPDLGSSTIYDRNEQETGAAVEKSVIPSRGKNPNFLFAEETSIPELKSIAKTIRDKLDGIVSYWTFRHISNAGMEGFNNKIRWLIKQAYGFRDREYFTLKIYQLPEISGSKEL